MEDGYLFIRPGTIPGHRQAPVTREVVIRAVQLANGRHHAGAVVFHCVYEDESEDESKSAAVFGLERGPISGEQRNQFWLRIRVR